jgi:orotidine-5'-phosphate decarboxylase
MSRSKFVERLEKGWSEGRTISVGLDVEVSRLPKELRQLHDSDGILEFHRHLINATKHVALAYKPQSAVYEALGAPGPKLLRQTIELVRELAPEATVILDAKRADIGSTNDFYVRAAFDYYDADAITVHPYLGPEAMQPFLDQKDKGVIVLCRTSNPGAGRYQDLMVEGRPLYQHIAADVSETWNVNGNCGLVVGATYPDEMKAVRNIVGDMPILVPGIGAQGGDLVATAKAGMLPGTRGLIFHASRSLMYAFEKSDLGVEAAAKAEIDRMHQQILHAAPQQQG